MAVACFLRGLARDKTAAARTEKSRFQHETPAVASSLLSNLQTTTVNVCLSTEFETEDKLEYRFNPLISQELHFKVRAPNDAHVALTTGPTEGNPMIEVSNMIVYLKTLNGPFVLSPDSHSVSVTIFNVFICS